MKRIKTEARKDWQKIVSSQGLTYHTVDNIPYWDETAYYQFSSQEVDMLEKSTNDLHALCLSAVQHIIDEKRYAELQIPNIAVSLIENSWERETAAIYGRFDLQYDGKSPPKMLEYNADTPTSLVEAAVVQWFWMEEKFKGADQFNSIHDRLIAKWKELTGYINNKLYFTYMDTWEDYMNVTYMQDVATQGGFTTVSIPIEEIGWDSKTRKFIDTDMYTMRSIFKLYPWEWLLKDQYAQHIATSFDETTWIEPPWKMLLSNKGILPILWELNPNHPNLLPAFAHDEPRLMEYVKKPLYSREGANIEVVSQAGIFKTDGKYGQEGFIYQQYCAPSNFDGNFPVLGSWVIDGEAAGIGIRESNKLVTDNFSRFVPHIMKD
jgi:glutathionylspermidine synthase